MVKFFCLLFSVFSISFVNTIIDFFSYNFYDKNFSRFSKFVNIAVYPFLKPSCKFSIRSSDSLKMVTFIFEAQ